MPSDSYEPPYFRDARLKIKRAREHIDEFDAYASEVFGRNFAPYAVTSKIDAKTGEYMMEYFADAKIVQRFAILCGDAVHSLRTALDFAWYELTIEDSITPHTQIKFPVYPTRKHLEDFFEAREKQNSILSVKKVMLDLIQPYKGGHLVGDLIYALHQLDLHDKHRLPIPQVQISHIWEIGADDRTIEGTPVSYAPDLINTYGSKDHDQGELCASIVFGKGVLSVEGKPVGKTLRHFDTAVEVALMCLHYR